MVAGPHGIASTVFGILLVIEPLIGAVVLTLWIGAYALVFGVFLLVLGFQLHSKREAHLRKAPAAAKRAQARTKRVFWRHSARLKKTI